MKEAPKPPRTFLEFVIDCNCNRRPPAIPNRIVSSKPNQCRVPSSPGDARGGETFGGFLKEAPKPPRTFLEFVIDCNCNRRPPAIPNRIVSSKPSQCRTPPAPGMQGEGKRLGLLERSPKPPRTFLESVIDCNCNRRPPAIPNRIASSKPNQCRAPPAPGMQGAKPLAIK